MHSFVIRKHKNIIALYLLMVFIMPSVIKIEHHHNHKFCKETSEKQFYDLHKKCVICSFEFSFFVTSEIKADIQKDQTSDNYFISYQSIFLSNQHSHSFLLRAPPSVLS